MRFFQILCLAAFISNSYADSGFVDLKGLEHHPLIVASDKIANVLYFSTTDCPIANGYTQRVNELESEYADKGFQFFFIHTDRDTLPKNALAHKQAYKLHLTVLIDSKHELVHKTGVSTTPEVAVILKDGSIAYRGRIDNWYEGFGKKRNVVTQTELRDALDALLVGAKVPIERTRAVGCAIPSLK